MIDLTSHNRLTEAGLQLRNRLFKGKKEKTTDH
jgi:hypothetical protein